MSFTPQGPVHPKATEHLSVCPACGSANHPFFYWGKSLYDAYWHKFERCHNCGLVFVNPRVPAKEIEGRVQSGEGAEGRFLRELPFDLSEVRHNMVKPVRAALSTRLPSGQSASWLDVGCAIGNLLHVAQACGFDPHGLELNHAMVQWAAQHRPALNIQQGLFADLDPMLKFTVISADNVLEHLHDPLGFLMEARERLDAHGLMAIRVPNFNNFARPLMQATGRLARCWMTDPDAHPCIWSRKPLVAVLHRAGLRPVRIMEHLMVTYPLKHILGARLGKTEDWKLRWAAAGFPALHWLDRIFPRGGIDITVIAERI